MKFSHLDEGQQQLFNFMYYALHCKLAEKNNEKRPKLFETFVSVQMFLSGVAGVGKSFLITSITEWLERVLDQPSVLVTASAGKVTTGVNGFTFHSAFHLPVKSGLKFYGCKSLSDETFHVLRNKY